METTAYASLLRLDRQARSVATIELVARGQVPGVHQMEAGDVNEKNAMLRAVMRTDTDVVYVQDLTGVESAALALSAASEHNKLVIATLYKLLRCCGAHAFREAGDRALARGERHRAHSGAAAPSPSLPRVPGEYNGPGDPAGRRAGRE
jgi:hypothetical protein